jgi:CxxC motif-containing protein (DUF1111 family)
MGNIRSVVLNRWAFLFYVLVIASAQISPPTPRGALSGLSSSEISAFQTGQAAFNEVERPADGLGPIFNGRSCNECHPNGAGSARISNIVGTGTAAQWNAGGPVLQVNAIIGFLPEPIPRNIAVGRRRSMTTQGLGLVGAIPDADLLAEQASQLSSFPLLAGKANIVIDAVTGSQRVGRIGQQSQLPNSTSFAAEAYLREMGITTPFFPNEEARFNNPANLARNPRPGLNDDGADVLAFGIYMDLLAPPTSNPPGSSSAIAQVNTGSNIFSNIGCAVCHKPSWTTGSHSVAALSGKTIKPYSDWLLHDMGSSGDRIAQGTDSNAQPIPGSWMRTTPLWGLRLNSTLWHDGSVRQGDYTGAINKHAGQGAASKAAFNGLSSSNKQALLAFLGSL